MTTATLTLAEFLLARIAEDEAVAERAGSFTPWDETFRCDNYGHLTVQPSRVLAECAAKRAIVERLERISGGDTTELAWHEQGLFEAVGFLAAVYSDHADYRDEWRTS